MNDVRETHVDRVAEEPAQRGGAEDRLDLVARRVEALVGVGAVVVELLREHTGEELGGVIEIGVLLTRVDRLLAQVIPRWEQQCEDVLEHRQATVLLGERQRSDDGVVEVAPRALEYLAFGCVADRLHDVVRDRRGLLRETLPRGET